MRSVLEQRKLPEKARLPDTLRLRHQGVRYRFPVALLPGRPAQGVSEHHVDVVGARPRLAALDLSPSMPPTAWA